MRRWLPLAGVAALLVVLGVVAAGHRSSTPLDPNGTGPTGAKALVLLLREYGADVALVNGVPDARTSTAVVLADQLDDGRRAALDGWVRSGGRLVVADPGSPLQVGAATTVDVAHPTGSCPGLPGVDSLDVGASYFLRDLGEGSGCFGTHVSEGASAGQAWFLLRRRVGAGEVVGLGGAGVWTNERLDHDANAALAVDLLAPHGPGERVAVLVASPPGTGHAGAYHLLSPRVHTALWELVIAFAAFAWWRGRRLGRPVAEPQPVELEASELVSAVGHLLQQSDNRVAAATQLRRSTRRWLAGRAGLPPNADADAIAAALPFADPESARAVLNDSDVVDDAQLVGVAAGLSALRREIGGG